NYVPNQMAVGDFNNDGKPDLVVDSYQGGGSNSFPVNILLGNGDGTFRLGSTTVIPAEGKGITERVEFLRVGDFNNDGKADVVVGINESVSPDKFWRVHILLGKGDGTLNAPVPDPNDTLVNRLTLNDMQLAD